jgi:hypothetical protein
MAIPSDIHFLVDKCAARIEALELSGEEQGEYSTMLSRLEDQIDRKEPDWKIVEECLTYLDRLETRVA